jgi:hypothetical protein
MLPSAESNFSGFQQASIVVKAEYKAIVSARLKYNHGKNTKDNCLVYQKEMNILVF